MLKLINVNLLTDNCLNISRYPPDARRPSSGRQIDLAVEGLAERTTGEICLDKEKIAGPPHRMALTSIVPERKRSIDNNSLENQKQTNKKLQDYDDNWGNFLCFKKVLNAFKINDCFLAGGEYL